jgi:tRNA(Ile)-lysidine synthase
MLEQFKSNIKQNLGISFESKIIVAVSGGIDSMMLLHLSKLVFTNIAIAHCNFNLRGNESDNDEFFVKEYARKYSIDFYCKQFNTEEFAKNHKISIQEAARELRFRWFYDLLKDINFDFIALGHNKNDSIETFIFNLIRGSGLKGLSGIQLQNNKIIRPLLFAERNTIEQFAKKENIKFREDSSNKTTKYSRNKIRHEIIPNLKEINPKAENHIHKTIDLLKETNMIVKEKIEELSKKLILKEYKVVKIRINGLLELPYCSLFLFETLSNYNFNSSTVEDIINSLLRESGKVFYSKTHQIVKDRNYLFINEIEQNNIKDLMIEKDIRSIENPIKLNIQIAENLNFKIPTAKNIACIDLDTIAFPLKLRKWREGDNFIPLGMNHYKKLSDFFIDEKLSIYEKQNTMILCNANDQIIWIVNHRIDNRFKITPSTKNIYLIEIQP